MIFCIQTKYKVLIEKGSKEGLRFHSITTETPFQVDANILLKQTSK